LLFGYQVSARGLEGDVRAACELASTSTHTRVVDCINPHSIITAKSDSHFQQALSNADILLPDGTGIILAARLLGLPIRQRVAGTEFFLRLSETANRAGGARYFFLGSTEVVLSKIEKRLGKDFPHITTCGTLSPPFKSAFSAQDSRRMIEHINAAQPDVLWVGMTAPKQEKWIEANRDALEVPLVCAVGAVFDFYSGEKARSPKWARNLGLEWLPRLLREPQRLWRRNFISTPLFLADVATAKLRQLAK
jgi:N-acetylglucosaminyldiphosphoundecaprenol N-acetyl-beta-D-mannosaminyltransferase